MALAYLTDPNIQFMNRSGVPNAGGSVRVFYNGTDDPATTYCDFEGTANPADIRLDIDGRAVIIAVAGIAYRVEVYDDSGALMWTTINVTPMTYSENSFTDEDKVKLDGIQSGAQKNVQSDWRQDDSTKDDYIKNKPKVTHVTTTIEGPGDDIVEDISHADINLNTGAVTCNDFEAGFIAPNVAEPPEETKLLAIGAGESIPSWKKIGNVQKKADWNEPDESSASFIMNKPGIVDISIVNDDSGEHPIYWFQAYSQASTINKGLLLAKYKAALNTVRTRELGYLLPSLDAIPMKDADIKVLETVTVRYDSGGQVNLYVADGEAYNVVLAADSGVVVNLATNSGNTLHTVLKVSTETTSDCVEFTLQWLDEALVQHRLIIPMNDTDKSFYFDVYIREVAHNSNIYSVARVSDFPCGFRTSPPVYTTRDNNTNWIGRNI